MKKDTTKEIKAEKKMKLKTKIMAAFAGAAAFTTLGWAGGDYNSPSTEQATVSYTSYEDSSHYTVHTDNGTYTDNNSLLKFKFNSSDIARQLRPGCTYDFNVHGWRSSVLKTVPNIDSITFVPTLTCPKAPSKNA